MARTWTFGQKVGVGFAGTVALTLVMGVVAIYALRAVVASKDLVIDRNAQALIAAEALRADVEHKVAAARGFLLTGESRFEARFAEMRQKVATDIIELRGFVLTEAGRDLVATVERQENEHHGALEVVMALKKKEAAPADIAKAFDDLALPKRDALAATMGSLVTREKSLLDEAERAASDQASMAITVVIAVAVVAVIAAACAAILLTRALGRQIGAAVGQVQGSSAELQAAANQQATGAKEQATAMSEITTTINELLATSRQIAESAQRVAQIAGKTASAARTGDGTVERAHEAIGAIRRQVDLIVNHMLELGGKSQQIGAVLEIVAELAEQTNILAINATIEAAGAGETGKRFGVVADEIRKLADRVAGSTKEIRALIDEVRGAVNTTVMATETGAKAVEGGSRQFADVASSFKEIGGLVSTTTEAAREIELSTKQQTTAVEQVNAAIANVAQATKETAVSSSQTLQTASQLASLSRDLLRLVQPQGAAAGV
ncbi:MAG: CHASE3 domain-containing protein [Planctomycetes bacterium]|nr:CHASE3 domain-containing protein [Planctomycetota bacterium]